METKGSERKSSETMEAMPGSEIISSGFLARALLFTSLQTICAPSRIGFSEPKGKSEKDCLLVGSLLNSTVELNYGENCCLRIPRSNIERGTRTHPYTYNFHPNQPELPWQLVK